MNNWKYKDQQQAIDDCILRNKVVVKVLGNKPIIRVYVNNDVEDPEKTLRSSEHYKYFSERYGGSYPHVEFKYAKGFPLRSQINFRY